MKIKKYDSESLYQNIDLFCNLYNKTFTAVVNREIVEQRFLENPYDDLLMYVAIEEGRIVANYSALPLRVVVDGIERKAAIAVNTMTDSDYTGRGLFTTLAKALYEDLEKKGYAFIMCFPNYMSNRILNTRLGWKTVYEVPTLKLSIASFGEVTIDTKAVLSQPNEGFCEEKNENRVYVKMSSEYMTWRFTKNKDKHYKVLFADNDNWLIYQFYNNEINITIISCTDRMKEKALIQRVISIGKCKKYDYITTWCMVNTETHSFLEKLGFRLSSPIRTFAIKCFDESIASTVYDYRSWRIQMGDDNTY